MNQREQETNYPSNILSESVALIPKLILQGAYEPPPPTPHISEKMKRTGRKSVEKTTIKRKIGVTARPIVKSRPSALLLFIFTIFVH